MVKDFPDENENLCARPADGYGAKRLRAAPNHFLFPCRATSRASGAIDSVVKRQLAYGLYEMALTPGGDALYVASAESFKDVQGAWSISWTPRP